MTNKSPLPVFNHVAISVPDSEAAVKWYMSVFGFRQLAPALHVTRKEMPEAFIFKLYDDSLQEFKIAWLGTGHSVGLEIFEFINPKQQKADPLSFEYTRGGFFHVAMTVGDPEALCEVILKAGGRKLGETVNLPKGNLVVYCQDPWGNAIELLTDTFEQLMANGTSD